MWQSLGDVSDLDTHASCKEKRNVPDGENHKYFHCENRLQPKCCNYRRDHSLYVRKIAFEDECDSGCGKKQSGKL